MSKRAASPPPPTVPAIKLAKGDDNVWEISTASSNVWDMIQEPDNKPKEFKPVEGGPKAKIVKTFVLNYKPKMEVHIALNGPCPELRFVSDDGVFTMTGDEFIQLTGNSFGPQQFDRVRLEPVDGEDGCFRLARYAKTPSGMSELNPEAVLELNKYAARRLKAKLGDITDHVIALMASEKVILTMFGCVVDVYKREYGRLNTLRPINEHFHELSRIVEMYVPGVVMVKDFVEKLQCKELTSRFNHYNMLSTVLTQKDYLYELTL